MKKIILGILGLMLMTSFVLADTYSVGDDSFNLPQISVQGNYLDDNTHNTYFACKSGLDGDFDIVEMSATDNCEVSRVFNPIESELGNHIYSTIISYVSREWTSSTGWQTVDEGTDNSQIYEFDIDYNIPEDDFSITDWISGLFQGIQAFFCDNFGLFCEDQIGWIYQEDADSYVFQSWYVGEEEEPIDGDWDTYGRADDVGYIFINYTKPSNALISSLWTGKTEGGIFNISINSDCWEQNILQFKVQSNIMTYTSNSWSCWDGSNWITIYNAGNNDKIYEEAMYWHIQ